MRRRPPGRKAAAESVALARKTAAAAAPVLTPLGCRQKGKSPLWIADHGLWVVLVDLQPGILTVGASFLWWVQSRWSFDQGVRLTDLDDADAMARRAGEEVAVLRSRFPSIAAIAAFLAAQGSDAAWPLYHAAVASGLAGERDAARRFFQRLLEKPTSRDWEIELSSRARALLEVLDEPASFGAAVGELVDRMRALQGLPPLEASPI